MGRTAFERRFAGAGLRRPQAGTVTEPEWYFWASAIPLQGYSRLRARADQPRFVGEDDGLSPVMKVQLHEDAFDVGFHRALRHDQGVGYLLVRKATRDEQEDLSLPLGELGELLAALGRLRCRRLRKPVD